MLDLPKQFIDKYQGLLGDKEAKNFFNALNQEPRKAFRINTLKENQQISYSIKDPIPVVENAYYGQVSGEDPEWVSGTVYSQDPSAMFPAYLANVQPGQNVLDLCAAPGGKTTLLAEELKNQGLLVANEISNSRVKILRENIERFGISNCLITNEDTSHLSKKFPSFFDTILVDAPCSGEGMFRKNPEAISYWSQDYVLKCQARQKEILNEAVKMLKNGGQLVYSTCTFSPEEDEEIVAWLVKSFNFKICSIKINSSKVGHGRKDFLSDKISGIENTLRFWPQDKIGEGQFLAILQMSGHSKSETKKKKQKKKRKIANNLTSAQEDLVNLVLKDFNLPSNLKNWKNTALASKNHVYLPAYTGDLNGLKIINNGVELGLLKKKRFEPGHQLAEVLGQTKQQQQIELKDTELYKKYLHGEAFKINTSLKGYVLVSYKNLIFSFGKIDANGMLKNFYPKGLRSVK